jgi:DNA-binding phage protein
MALTPSFTQTVIERVDRNSEFAQALLDEAATLFLNGEPETAGLAALTAKPSKSLHRRLSSAGNPGMDNLAAIFHAIRERLKVSLEAHSVAA